MKEIKLNTFKLAGLRLPHKTFNESGRSGVDCGMLWQKFSTDQIKDRIPEKLSDDVYAVYFDYEGDHTKPFSYFIGCKVKAGADTPEGLDTLLIPDGNYSTFLAEGNMPDCVANTWKKIWNSPIARAYSFDFEVYGPGSNDWNNASVDIYIST